MALYPAGKVPQYRLYYEIKKRVGLRPILALLKSLLALIRLRRRLKPSGRLYPFLLKVYKLQVGLWLISLGLHILWPRKRKKGGKKKGKEGKEEGKGKEEGVKGKAGEVSKEGKENKGEDKKKGKGGRRIRIISLS